MKKTLALKPDSAQVMNNLAYLYDERLNQPTRPTISRKKARSIQADDPSTATPSAGFSINAAITSKPWTLIQESAAKIPDQPEIQFHLGMASYMMGQAGAARKAFAERRQIVVDFPGKNEIPARLELLGGRLRQTQ